MSFTPGAGTRFLVSTGASGTTPLSGPLSITGGTATTNTPVLSATQTWNNAAVTFTGWQLNVTDTASNASSLLMDLQVGGVSVFSVTKIPAVSGFTSMQLDGLVFAKQKNANNARIVINAAQIGMSGTGPGFTGPYVNSGSGFGWWSVNDIAAGGVIDLVLARDAANTLAQRNGVNAQTFNIYNTFTDASNFERGFVRWSAGVLQIGTAGNGTGVPNRNVEISIGSATRWIFNGAGNFLAGVDNAYDIGSTGANRPRNVFWAGYQEMAEMTAPAAPAANFVRIYAEDNGSGKTRLMALFATGAAQQIAIEP